jgi:hypothetical protein
MVEDRKISDVVLSIEGKLDKLLGLFRNIDNNNKIIIDKINKLGQPKINKKYETDGTQINLKDKDFVGAIPGMSTPDSMFATPAQENIDDLLSPNRELLEETVPKGIRRDLRKPVDPKKNKKITVSQQILLPDGKGVFLAGVEISDAAGEIIKQTRTNAKGRWMAPLLAGEYMVHILKRQNETLKVPIELRYKITIPESEKPLELPTPELSDIYRK